MDRNTLEKLLREQMPLAKAMDVRVFSLDAASVELGCSLRSNHNHLSTAFGGSLSALMILSAYCQLFQIISGKGHVLLKKSEMDFLLPVKEDLRAVCLKPSVEASAEFLRTYKKKGTARLSLTSQIVLSNGKTAARMHAEFVGKT